MRVRRVVTGHDATGKSIFASDEMVEPIEIALAPGLKFHRLWGADSTPIRIKALPPHLTYFPPLGASGSSSPLRPRPTLRPPASRRGAGIR